MRLRTNTTARAVDVAGHRLLVAALDGRDEQLLYDRLVIGTGATSVLPPIDGLRDTEAGPALGRVDGAHVLHTMGDMFAVLDSIESRLVETALVVGAGYIGWPTR
jgi:NADPH-dependent 2,4-dienoyl-CoA reductase/sulfur reductase-like enzyme